VVNGEHYLGADGRNRIYRMRRNLYGVITPVRTGINKSMNFWKELLINAVYLAAVLALVYVLTYTDIVGHLLAY